MIGLLIFAGGICLIAYICAIFIIGAKLQDWAMARGYPDIAIPWAFSMFMLIVIPASIVAAVFA
jgi:hypothetical protein